MEQDRERWNKKYRENQFSLENPSEILVKYIDLVPKGKALDIAAGLGRNSLFLAKLGFYVDAIDYSDVAVETLKDLHKNINPIQADLDSYQIEKNKYDLIINFNYLNRRLFPQIIYGLKENGFLFFETFLDGEEEGLAQPSNPDFLLRKNELLHSFLRLRILFYQEKKVIKCDGSKSYLASLIAKKEC